MNDVEVMLMVIVGIM